MILQGNIQLSNGEINGNPLPFHFMGYSVISTLQFFYQFFESII